MAAGLVRAAILSTQLRRCVLLLKGCAAIRALACIMSYSLTGLRRWLWPRPTGLEPLPCLESGAAWNPRPAGWNRALERDLVFCGLDLGGIGSFDAVDL